jgi:hypothetical protein
VFRQREGAVTGAKSISRLGAGQRFDHWRRREGQDEQEKKDARHGFVVS